MHRLRIVAAAAFLAISTGAALVPALAQTPGVRPMDSGSALIGLAVYSSDGEQLGEVVQVALYGGEPAVRAEIGAFLGEQGAATAIIPAAMMERKSDHLELKMTASEIRETIAKQKGEGTP
jgi:hypothetical protein